MSSDRLPNINPYEPPATDPAGDEQDEAQSMASKDRPQWWHLAIFLACVVINLGAIAVSLYVAGFDFVEMTVSYADLTRRCAHALLAALTMAAVGIMFVYWFRRRAFPRQPGEWMLVAAGVCSWIGLVASRIPIAGVHSSSLSTDVVLMIVQAAILIFGGFVTRHGRLWTTSLVAWGLSIAMLALVNYYVLSMVRRQTIAVPSWLELSINIAFIVASLIGTIAFFAAVIVDIRRRESRGWMHATGLGWIVAFILLSTLETIAAMMRID